MSTGQSEDERAILALLCEYCDSIDRGDLDACAALFADGAWGIVGDLAHGHEAVRAQLDNVTLYDGIPRTRHLMSNIQVIIDDDGLGASARCCITVMQCVPDDFPMQAIFIGSYRDRLLKRDGKWRFAERAITPDLVGDMSRHRSDMA
jgi:hypothetical protein